MTSFQKLRLTWEQKAKILKECNRRGVQGVQNSIVRIYLWAQKSFPLQRRHSACTIRRILYQARIIEEMAHSYIRRQKSSVSCIYTIIEHKLLQWMLRTWQSGMQLTDALISEKDDTFVLVLVL